MPSVQSHFQAPPPIRTNTADSQSSGAMSPGSETMSPTTTTTFGRRAQNAVSPTEESFFGAISSRMRRGRSRSRSRVSKTRDRSKSPRVLPPEQFPPSSNTQPTSPTYTSQRPQQPRHASTMSQGSVKSPAATPSRPSLQGPQRRSTGSSDMWHGRQTNSWLFNDYSVRRDLFHIGRKDSS